jgi:hypothetical protein
LVPVSVTWTYRLRLTRQLPGRVIAAISFTVNERILSSHTLQSDSQMGAGLEER